METYDPADSEMIKAVESILGSLSEAVETTNNLRKQAAERRGPTVLGSREFIRWNFIYGAFSLVIPLLGAAQKHLETARAILKRQSLG